MSTELVPAPKRPEDFPPEVHASLKELRAIAKAATSRQDPTLRKATEDEVALAVALLKPTACGARSNRTGLPCAVARVRGAKTCWKHGSGNKRSLAKAERRLATAVSPVLRKLQDYAMDGDKQVRTAAVKAAADLLDRAGVGALVQAKVLQATAAATTKAAGPAGVTVNIGFLSSGTTEPPAITVKAVTVDKD